MNAGRPPFERDTNQDGDTNPVKKALDEFRRMTPIVTQALVLTVIGSWVLNLFLSKYVLECIPYFIITKYEVYRLVTSLLVNPEFFQVLFACLMLVQHCRPVEESIGSASMLWLALVVFTFLVNVLYCIFQLTAVAGGSTGAVMYWETPGIWSPLIGILTFESCRASSFQQQRLFCNFFRVPTKVFPLCLLLIVIFMTAGRSKFTLVTSTGIGYLIGLNLDSGVLAAPSFAVRLLDAHFRGSQGWIAVTASIGVEAWTQDREPLISGLPSLQGVSGQGTDQSMTVADSASGRTLGGTNQRNVDARTARLQALERQHV